MATEIHRADPRMRKLTVVVLGVALVVAVLLMAWFHRWLEATTDAMPAGEVANSLQRMIGVTSLGCGFCLLLLAAYAAHLGRRVGTGRRWPLRTARVVRDTPVRSGDDALAFGRRLQLGAIALIAVAIAFGVLGWRAFG